MKKITLAAVAAAAIALPAMAQEEEQQLQLTPEMLAQIQQQLQARPSFDFSKLETLLPDVVGEVDGDKYTKAEFIEALKNDPQVTITLANTPAEALPETLSLLARHMMTVDMLGKLCPELTVEQAKEAFAAKLGELSEAERSAFDAALKQQGLTPEAYVEQVSQNPDYRKQMAIMEYFEKLIKKEDVGNAEAVKKFYDEKRETYFKNDVNDLSASHILIALAPDASEEERQAALDKANSVLNALKDGADFKKLALENSDCPSKTHGGELGIFAPGNMVPEFSEAVMTAAPGELIDHPVKTQFGYHVIRREEVPEYVPFENVKDEIKEYLKNIFVQETLDKLADEHIRSFIEVPSAEKDE